MTVERGDVVIVGAGLAGARCAEALRTAGHPGRIVVFGAEPHAPYERPALSKDILTGTRDGAVLRLRTQAFWDERRIELRPGCAVEELDLEARRVTAGGDVVSFEHVVLATGLRARRLPTIPDGAGVHVLRTLDDAESLRRELRPGARLVVMGAGFVGLEVASSALTIGASALVVDPAATPFARTLGPEVGELLGNRACERGAELRLGRTVVAVERGPDARPRAVVLDDGTRFPCDLLLVGVGAIPNTELAHGQLNLSEDGGIATDEAGRTGVVGVYACGDVASRPYPGHVEALRLEHWGGAASSARAVASAIAGLPPPNEAPPFFWSDQFGWRLQAVGVPSGSLSVYLDDDVDREGHVARYCDDRGRLVGAVAINRPHELASLRAELHVASQAISVESI
jgi:3-phenylpropionate/trans-cinnamate dioxygenase ferredoxin reductase subunit